MELIDTHSHIYSKEFDADRDSAISRALEAGVHKIILPNIDSTTLNSLLELCKLYPQICFPAIGLHPTSVNESYKEELKIIENQISQNNYVAIGETGIDLYWDKTFIKEQCDAFSFQVDLAQQLKIPVIIHCRESFHEIIQVLEKKAYQKYQGIFHSFQGTKEQALQVIDMGFKIGINGVVTFKKSHLQEVVNQIPLGEIVLETDTPYLTPVPYRGKRNESSYLLHIAQKISEIRGESIEIITQTTSETAKKLFNFI